MTPKLNLYIAELSDLEDTIKHAKSSIIATSIDAGRIVRQARIDLKRSAGSVGYKVGISSSQLRKLEAGRHIFTSTLLSKIAKELNI